MFTGQVPFGTSPKSIGSAAADFGYLDPVVEKMIRQEPKERPDSIEAIKQELELRGHEFVAYQRLDAARRTAVPASLPNDPLNGEDVRATDFEYVPGYLLFRFKPQPPPAWLMTLRDLRDFRSYSGAAEPALVDLIGDGKARVRASESTAVGTRKFVEEWAQSTNREYRQNLERNAAEAQERHRQTVSRQRERQEEIARVSTLLRER